MHPFEISGIDHVAIRVKNFDRSVKWYNKVLGLKKVTPKEWGPFPIFMMKDKFGVAIFPASLKDESLPHSSKNVKIDHFAFNVSIENFIIAQNYFDEIKEYYEFQDHHYFHSIYLKDPDDHTVELTTLVVGDDFYS